jgi:hypothetical protein
MSESQKDLMFEDKKTSQFIKAMIYGHPASISMLVFGVIFGALVFPGWMTGDSGTQWAEASGIFLISDWHSPHLSWAWKQLKPIEYRQQIPFVLQILSYFGGMVLICVWIEKRSKKIALLFLLVVMVAPVTWTVAWVTKDAFFLSAVSLATGLGLFGLDHSRRVWYLSVPVFGVASLGRPYMAPVVLLWIICIYVLFSKRKVTKKSVVVSLLIFSVSLMFLLIYVPNQIGVYKTYVSGSTKFLDFARIECGARPILESTPERGLIPREFMVNLDKGDICSFYDPYIWDPLIWPPGESASVRLPTSDGEAEILTSKWIELWSENLNVLAEMRLRMFGEFLMARNNLEIPKDISSLVEDEKIGDVSVDVKKWGGYLPSRGSKALAVVGSPIVLLANLTTWFTIPGIGILLFPLSLLFSRNTRKYVYNNSMFTFAYLSMGLIWAITFAWIAPANMTRYMSPGIFFGITASATIWAAGLVRDHK